jgi:hypothetical protein
MLHLYHIPFRFAPMHMGDIIYGLSLLAFCLRNRNGSALQHIWDWRQAMIKGEGFLQGDCGTDARNAFLAVRMHIYA